MSAPDTNTEKTKPAHKTPIVGMIAMVVFALVLLFALVSWLSYDADTEGGEAGQSDEGTLTAPQDTRPADTAQE